MKKRLLIIVSIIIGICSILVGTIAFYRIVVNGKINASTGNAVFVLKDENSNVWNNKEIDLGKVNPGDSGSFVVTMDASSSNVDMYATLEIDRGSLPTNLKFYTTSDHKSELHKYYSFLEKDGTSSETLTIYWYWNPYIDDIEDSKFINIDNIEANIKVSAVQISEYAMMKNGCNYNTSTKTCVGTEFWSDDYKPYIRTINFGNDLSNMPSSCTEENLCFDISYDANQNKKVYGYLVDSGLTVSETDSSTSTTTEKSLYNLYIVSEAPIFAPSSCEHIFSFFKYDSNYNCISNLISINFNNNFNTSSITDMKYMFYECESLISLDLSSFNTSKVTNMKDIFAYCTSLTNLDLSSFNTSNAENMSGMFSGMTSLTSIDLSSFNTSNVTGMITMFSGCKSLTTLDLSSFNTSKVTDMSAMFYGSRSLTSLDLSSFNTMNVESILTMFRYCTSLTKIDLGTFNTSNVTLMGGMFYNCKSLTTLDLSSFNTSKVTNMDGMFLGCTSLTNLDLSSFNTSSVTYYGYGSGSTEYGMFTNCKNLVTTINIMNANVTNYTYMFSGAATENGAKIIVNYTLETESLVDNMIATKSDTSNVVKGKQI